MLKAFNTAATDTRGGWQPSLSLELAIAEALEQRSSGSRNATGAPGTPAAGSERAAGSATASSQDPVDGGALFDAVPDWSSQHPVTATRTAGASES